MNEKVLKRKAKSLKDRDKSIRQKEDSPGNVKISIIRQASHEIQGAFFSVASVGAMVKLAVENGEETKDLLKHLMDACQTFKYRLSNFLEYTRYDAGLRDTRLEIVNIRPLLKRVVDENRVLANENNVK